MAYKISGTTVIDDSRNILGVSVTAANIFNIPSGNTAARPGSPSTGEIRFNTETNNFEIYSGSGWILVSSTAE